MAFFVKLENESYGDFLKVWKVLSGDFEVTLTRCSVRIYRGAIMFYLVRRRGSNNTAGIDSG